MRDNSKSTELFYVEYESVKRLFFSPDDFFIAIDGLALVLEACLNKHLKWTQNGSGVYLHAIYYMERTLNMLIKLKPNLRLVFFQQIDQAIEKCEREVNRDELTLVYNLAVLHFKSIEAFRGRVLFFTSFREYMTHMKDERIICYMGFSYVDTNLVNNEELAEILRRHFIQTIQVNLEMGINVILTKNFW